MRLCTRVMPTVLLAAGLSPKAAAAAPETRSAETRPAADEAQAAETAGAYVRKKYPEITGKLAPAHARAVEALMPGVTTFYFSAGGLYPIPTMGAHVRRILAVRAKDGQIALDFDQTVKDADAPAALAGILPRATRSNLLRVAAAIAQLLPLDPFFRSPEGELKLRRGPGRRETAFMAGPGWKYEVAFNPDGRVGSIVREDRRPRPICYQHRARAQALLDRKHPGWRAGDVVWDRATAELARSHYVYEVQGADGARRGLALVEKGPGAARFAEADDRAGLEALVREALGSVEQKDAAEAAAVALDLLARAGALPRPPLGGLFFDVTRGVEGSLARSRELGIDVAFDADGRLRAVR